MPSKIAQKNKRLNDAERDAGKTVLESLPQRLVLEVTNRCNLRCAMCGQSHRTFDGHDMERTLFERTEPLWATTYDATLFGWGEPLLNKDLGYFFDRLRVHEPQIFVLTNGRLLTEELTRRFVDGDLTFLNFSVDGATAETYNRIRRGSDFDIVIENIRRVVALRKASGKKTPYLRMVFVGMVDNIEEFPRYVELCHELGMDEAKMVNMIAYSETMADQVLIHQPELTNRILDEAEAIAERLGIRLTIPERFDVETLRERMAAPEAVQDEAAHKVCPRPFEEMFVQSDGRVRLCMLSNEVMGDLNRESALDIWNGERLREMRRRVNSGNPPDTCRHCPQYREMDINNPASYFQFDTVLPGTPEQEEA